MVTQFDEKGKIFTQVVSKEAVKVAIQTPYQLIRGKIYVRPDARMKDELSKEEGFLAVTDATIYNLRNEELFQSHFMVINIAQIVWIIPEEDLKR